MRLFRPWAIAVLVIDSRGIFFRGEGRSVIGRRQQSTAGTVLGNAATVITLSHWPKSGTPQALKADTSTEIAFKYLAAPRFHVAAVAASNNHFDEDGLAGLYALIEPEAATAMQDLVAG